MNSMEDRFLISLTENPSFSEVMAFILIGLAVVMGILILLCIIISFIGVFFIKKEKSKINTTAVTQNASSINTNKN